MNVIFITPIFSKLMQYNKNNEDHVFQLHKDPVREGDPTRLPRLVLYFNFYYMFLSPTCQETEWNQVKLIVNVTKIRRAHLVTSNLFSKGRPIVARCAIKCRLKNGHR